MSLAGYSPWGRRESDVTEPKEQPPKKGFPGGSDGKELACNTEDAGLIPGSGRCPGEGNGSPLQYSCLESSVDRGDSGASVHGVPKSWPRLSTHAGKRFSNETQKEVAPPPQQEKTENENRHWPVFSSLRRKQPYCEKGKLIHKQETRVSAKMTSSFQIGVLLAVS